MFYSYSVKLIFDPAGIHNRITITPTQFANLSWVDQRDNQNSFTTTNSGFTVTSNLTAPANGVCSFTGNIPTTSVNYALVQANYSCTNGSTGTAYIAMATNANSNSMIVTILGNTGLQSHSMLFQ